MLHCCPNALIADADACEPSGEYITWGHRYGNKGKYITYLQKEFTRECACFQVQPLLLWYNSYTRVLGPQQAACTQRQGH